MNDPIKLCVHCNCTLPLSEFYSAKTSRDGKEPYCKKCHSLYMSTYYTRHKDKIDDRNKTYYVSNKDKIREKAKEYRETNRESIKLRMAEYYLRNKEKINARIQSYREQHKEQLELTALQYRETHKEQIAQSGKRWRQANPDKVNVKASRRRARKANAPINDFTAEQWTAMKEHYGHRCVYCGKKSQRLTQDHITPISQGGSHTLTNIVPSCKACNNKKFTGPPLVPVQPLLL